MKFANLLVACAIALSTGAVTGCGYTQTFNAPEPEKSSAPKGEGEVAVSVIDHVSKPVVGATVTLTDAKGSPVGKPQETGADGKTTFKKVPLGTGYTVSAEDGGITGTQAGLGVDGAAPLVATVMLIPANGALGTIGGAVVDGFSGAPLDGATVSILGTQTTVKSNADGSFVLKNVPAGNPTVVAVIQGYREARTSLALKGGKLERADLKLYPAGSGTRFGRTLVTTRTTITEFDKAGNAIGGIKQGATQARLLPSGNTLIASGSGVAELNASNLVVWQYQPVLFGRVGAQGVSRSASGTVYLADSSNNRVLEITPGRKSNVERAVPFPFNRPMSVDRVDAARTVLVADAGSNRVLEVSDVGAIVWSVGDGSTNVLAHPTFASRLPNGNTLITDTGNHRVMEVNKALQLVWIYGGQGDRATCYLPNSAVRLPNGNTLIADTGNDRVIEVNAKGEIVYSIVKLDQPLFAERL